MVSLLTFKTPLAGLLLVVAYSSMVLDIIYIVKVHENQNSNTRPPAVITMLVGAIIHVLFSLQYFFLGAKGVLNKAMNIMSALLFCFLFELISTAIAIAYKHHSNYCPTDASNYSVCEGTLRGTVGLGFSLVGLDLIYGLYIAALVSKHGSWDRDLYNIPERKIPNADLEKAPAH